MEVFVGIDPSINSTGICIIIKENEDIVKEHYYIIKSGKLTKKEKEVQEKILDFDYVLYDKIDLSIYKDYHRFQEYWKTINLIRISKKVVECVYDCIPKNNIDYKIYIVEEGISYGSSIRTKSVFDLAGLNYLIREKFIDRDNIVFSIVPPTEIKKYVTGKGNANKDMVIELFRATKPILCELPKIDDIADAYYMAQYAEYLMKTEK